MTRVFRYYGRTLVLILMCLLLAIFLIGDVLGMRGSRGRGGSDRLNFIIGTAFGKAVYTNDLERAAQDAQIASHFNLMLPLPQGVDDRERALCQFLLLEEANQAGVRIAHDKAEQFVSQFPAEQVEALRVTYGQSLDGMYRAVARVMGAMVFEQYQAEAILGESPPRLQNFYRDNFQQATCKVATLDARGLLARVPEPTTEELTAHFEEAKNRDDAHTDDGLSFGYLLKDRVKIEYLTIDPKACENSIKVRDKDLQRYYDEHAAQRYTRAIATTAPAASNQPPKQEVIPFSEVRDRVRADLRRERAIEAAQRTMNELAGEARKAFGGTPAATSQPTFAELQARFSQDCPVEYHQTELLDASGIMRESGIGRAGATLGARRLPMSMLAFRVEGIATPQEGDATPILKINEPQLVMNTDSMSGKQESYQFFVFRVTQVAPKGPPASLEDVKLKAIENLKLRKAYDLAGEYANKIAARARAVGLDAAVAEADDLKAVLAEADAKSAAATQAASAPATPATTYIKNLEVKDANVSRRSAFVPGVGSAPKLAEQVFALADAAASSQPTTQGSQPSPQTSQPGEHQIIVSKAPGDFRWFVAEVKEVKPVYQQEFEAVRPNLERRMGESLLREFRGLWGNPEGIRRRATFAAAQAEHAG